MTPLTASIAARLKNKADASAKPYQYVLMHYGIERFLYRLGISGYAERFILKGGLAFLTYDPDFPRATQDMDFLGYANNHVSHIEAVVREICQIPVDVDDGLIFDLGSMRGQRINDPLEYTGVRIKCIALLDRSRIHLQMDFGFGDAVYPQPVQQHYPALLDDQPPPVIRTYPIETILAEKIHAIIKRDTDNSRLKDFYDIWFLSETRKIAGAVLSTALRGTFTQRSTPLPSHFRDGFFEEFEEIKASQWPAFRRKDGLDESLVFRDVLNRVEQFVEPLLEAIGNQTAAAMQWMPGDGWR